MSFEPLPTMTKISKRKAALTEKVEDKAYLPLEAIQVVKETATAKFFFLTVLKTID